MESNQYYQESQNNNNSYESVVKEEVEQNTVYEQNYYSTQVNYQLSDFTNNPELSSRSQNNMIGPIKSNSEEKGIKINLFIHR
jgi:hypothetical protein